MRAAVSLTDAALQQPAGKVDRGAAGRPEDEVERRLDLPAVEIAGGPGSSGHDRLRRTLLARAGDG